jgi:hypothetical protein
MSIRAGYSLITPALADMYFIKSSHINRDDVGPQAMATVTAANNSEASLTFESPLNTTLDLSNFCRSNDRRGTMKASFPALDLYLLQNWDLSGQLRERGGVFCEDYHQIRRTEDKMTWASFLVPTQGSTRFAPLDFGSFVCPCVL